MKNVSNAGYAHAKRNCKDFEIKNLGEYYDLYIQSDTLLLADVFENCRNICIKIYKLDTAKFPSAPWLAWKKALKMTKVELDKIRSFNWHQYVINSTKMN